MTPDPAVPTLVTDTDALEALCDEVADEEFYAFDTEFHTERTYWPNWRSSSWAGRAGWRWWIHWPWIPGPWRRLFRGPGTGVAHAAGQDIDILRTACGAAPATVFDTQVAAGFLGMSSPSLGRLVEQVLGIGLPKSRPAVGLAAPPAPPRQLAYAAGDVEHLLELRTAMVSRLEERGRLAWALEECALVLPGQRRPVVPEEAWWKVGDVRRLTGRSRGVAQEVAAWRERQAADTDRPRRSVLPDLAVLTIAQRPPRNRADLEHLRGVDARHLGQGRGRRDPRGGGAGRGAAGRRAAAATRAGGVQGVPGGRGGVCGLVRQIAEELEFDQGLLATRTDLAQLVVGEPGRLDVGWRAELVGRPIHRLLAGEVAAAFAADGRLVLEERGHRPDGPAPAG